MRHVVQEIASQGRNGDDALLHVSKEELHGLRTIAHAYGRDFTTNPKTGLPEAFGFADILRIAAPIAAGMVGGPMAGMAAGAAIGGATNKQNPLMGAVAGGIGGYGGGGLGNALATAGTGAATSAAASELATSAMASPTDAAAAAGVNAANSAVPAYAGTGADVGAPAQLYGADGGMSAADAMRGYEHAYQNSVTGGSDFMNNAQAMGREGATRMGDMRAGAQQLWDSPSQASDLMTEKNLKSVAMPIGASVMMNPASVIPPDEEGGDNGHRYRGEAWRDYRNVPTGMDYIQRSRAVPMFAQGGLTSIGVNPLMQARSASPMRGPVLGGGPVSSTMSNYFANQSAAPAAPARPPMQRTLPVGMGDYMQRYASQTRNIPQVQRVAQNTVLQVTDRSKAIPMGDPSQNWSPGGDSGPGGVTGPGSSGTADPSNPAVAAANAMSTAIAEALGIGASSNAAAAQAQADAANAAAAANEAGVTADAAAAGSAGSGGAGDGAGAGGGGSGNGDAGSGTGGSGDYKGGLLRAGGGLTSIGHFARNPDDPNDGLYLRGQGDGMSDDIHGRVGDSGNPIRVARNEYVVPADVVSDLGNGSSDAGASVLKQMGARVRAARHGTQKQGKRINPGKFVPA